MKPKNFPGRREQRQMAARGIVINADRGKRFTKKTPKSDWSAARAARRSGKISR